MNCDEAEELLVGLFDDDETTNMNLHPHLETCLECRSFFTDLILLRALELIARKQWGTIKPRQVVASEPRNPDGA